MASLSEFLSHSPTASVGARAVSYIRQLPLLLDSKDAALNAKARMAFKAQLDNEGHIRSNPTAELPQRLVQIYVLNAAIRHCDTKDKLSLNRLFYARAYQKALCGHYSDAWSDLGNISIQSDHVISLKTFLAILLNSNSISASEKKADEFMSQSLDQTTGFPSTPIKTHGLNSNDFLTLWYFNRPLCEKLLEHMDRFLILCSNLYYYESLSKVAPWHVIKELKVIAGNSIIAREGNRIAQYYRGNILYNRFGGEASGDKARGLAWLERAANQEHPRAMASLGNHLITSSKSDEIKRGVNLLEQAATKKSCIAQSRLGELYKSGTKGLDKDFSKSLHFFRLAASQLRPTALLNLSSFYSEGINVEKNPDIARILEFLGNKIPTKEVIPVLLAKLREQKVLIS